MIVAERGLIEVLYGTCLDCLFQKSTELSLYACDVVHSNKVKYAHKYRELTGLEASLL